jgi:hypothetical protein
MLGLIPVTGRYHFLLTSVVFRLKRTNYHLMHLVAFQFFSKTVSTRNNGNKDDGKTRWLVYALLGFEVDITIPRCRCHHRQEKEEE